MVIRIFAVLAIMLIGFWGCDDPQDKPIDPMDPPDTTQAPMDTVILRLKEAWQDTFIGFMHSVVIKEGYPTVYDTIDPVSFTIVDFIRDSILPSAIHFSYRFEEGPLSEYFRDESVFLMPVIIMENVQGSSHSKIELFTMDSTIQTYSSTNHLWIGGELSQVSGYFQKE